MRPACGTDNRIARRVASFEDNRSTTVCRSCPFFCLEFTGAAHVFMFTGKESKKLIEEAFNVVHFFAAHGKELLSAGSA